jgi:hypothetical protein
MKLPIVGQAYQVRSKNLNNQRCVNLFPVLDNQGGKNVAALYSTPGYIQLGELGDSPIRGMMRGKDNLLYVVAGQSFYEVYSNGTSVKRGTLTSYGTTPVKLKENNTQIMINAEDFGYIYTVSTKVFAQITDPDFIPGGDLGFINGYFIFNEPESDNFYISNINDGSSVDALDVSSANIDADNIVALLTAYQEVWFFGETTVEPWEYTGDADFPLNRIPRAALNIGCAARLSPVALDNGFMWLSRDERGGLHVVKSSGYSAQIVSTEAIDYQISQYSTVTDAIAYSYQIEGHLFYQITFPTGGATWVYDVSTGMWHEKAYTNTSTGALERHKSHYYARCFGLHVFSDSTSGKFYYYDMGTHTDAGDNITKLRTSRHQNNENKRVMWKSVEFDIESGTETDLSNDPQLQFRWSDDQGNIWSNVRLASLGKIGEYAKRIEFRRLGYSRDRILEIRTTEPIFISIVDAYAELSPTNG